MNNKKKIALWVIAALQFNATVYFVLVFALEGRGVTLFGTPLADIGPNKGIQVLGLILGVVLGWMALRMSLQRAERAEDIWEAVFPTIMMGDDRAIEAVWIGGDRAV
mgnify:CR=1 FL=1